MKHITLTTDVTAMSMQELSDSDRVMVEKAREAALRAYAPYSKFNVGAAVKLSNGEIVTGANQENAAFPSGTCAERSAIFYAHSQYPEAKVDAIAITAWQNGEYVENPCAPCGACRQAILEYETLAGKPIRVLLAGRDEVYIINGIAALLPLCFDKF
ncbi:MAG: cytidine deaminase [Muribaculaceae bacterium]|nr:cytidine deaminase [Muribaculaceae bacterium]